MMGNDEVSRVKQLYIDICNASISKDINMLNRILSKNYVLVHMTGKRQSKEDYINSIINGELKYYESKHESIEVTIEGNKAEIVGKTLILAAPFGISKSWWKLRQDLTLEKINDEWKIVKSIAASY